MTNTCTIVKGCCRPWAQKEYKYRGKTYRVCHMHLARIRRGSGPGAAKGRQVGVSPRVERNSARALLYLVDKTKRRTWNNCHRVRIDGAVYYQMPHRRRTSMVEEVAVPRMAAWNGRGWVSIRTDADGDGLRIDLTKAGSIAIEEARRGLR